MASISRIKKPPPPSSLTIAAPQPFSPPWITKAKPWPSPIGNNMTRALTFCWLVLALPVTGRSNDLPGGPFPTQSQEARANERAAYEKQTQARIAELASMQSASRARDQLAIKGTEARRRLQSAKSAAWTSFISTNRAAFQALRHEAALSPKSAIACTICGGDGSMGFCL